MKVLIAEDDPVSGLVLERTLQQWGYEIIRAKDGEEAWEMYSVEPVPARYYRLDDATRRWVGALPPHS